MFCVLSCVQLFAIPWTVALQAPLFMEFSRQEYWSGLPFPTPEDLPDPGTEPESLASLASALPTCCQSISLIQMCILLTLPFLTASAGGFHIHQKELEKSITKTMDQKTEL